MAVPATSDTVYLTCKSANGRYPKLKCEGHPLGLKFRGGREAVSKKGLEELEAQDAFKYYVQTGEITLTRKPPKESRGPAPRVVSGSSTATSAGAKAAAIPEEK